MKPAKEMTVLTNDLLATLERDGIVELPMLLDAHALERMQRAFVDRVEHVAYNGERGYKAIDPYRRFVDDLCSISRDYIDVATHPLVAELARQYIGDDAMITEAKGWRSLPTHDDFHGWHNDAWYDHDLEHVPRQLKLAVYLSDVSSGEFHYIRGTHGQRRHAHFSDEDVSGMLDRRLAMKASAGTAFLFDVSGIHRQSFPILEDRDVLFFVYNNPAVPLQDIDVRANRYRPLMLRASDLGDLSPSRAKLLGIGNTTLARTFATLDEPDTMRDFIDRVHHALIKGTRFVDRLDRRAKMILSKASSLRPRVRSW